jgi:endonuclease/exonuclease/phosphatase family metal-dependent hydrolase
MLLCASALMGLMSAMSAMGCGGGGSDDPDPDPDAMPDGPPDGPPAPPPDTVIDSRPAELSASASAVVTFSSPTAPPRTGLTLVFECADDGAAAFSPCTSPVTRTNLSSGSYALAVRARWMGGAADATPAMVSWTIDRTPPETTISAGPQGNTAPGTGSFTFASEAGATFECRIDGAAFAACTSPLQAQVALGDHTFEVRAKDALGNTDPSPAQRAYRGDITLATPPETMIVTKPLDLSANGTATVTFTSPTTPPAGLTLGFECAADGAATFAGCASPVTRNNLGSGSYSLAVRARWIGGPFDATPASASWTIDRTPPDTTITAGPMGDTEPGPAMFSFDSEAGATFECSLDGAAYAACTSPQAVEVTLGDHTFGVRASDALGNTDATPAIRTYRGAVVMVNPPETLILTQPAPLNASATATVTFTSMTTPPQGLTLAFECAEDGSTSFTTCTSPVTRTGLVSGSYSLAVRARWVGSSIDPTPAVASWMVDRTAPITTIGSGPMGDTPVGASAFTFSSEAGATFECSLDGAAFATCTSPLAVQVTAGSHTFEVRATDTLGNVESPAVSRAYRGVVVTQPTKLRLMAANITSGNGQSYDPGHGTRIFQGTRPDIVMIQEFNYKPGNTNTEIRAWVDTTFGTSFQFFRESGKNIPNGVISRYPILQSGVWEDTLAPDREFVWARIDVPGSKDLWAISVHLLTRDAPTRNSEAQALRDLINANVPTGDYLVIGGDFNTDGRTEACVSTLGAITDNGAPYPADQNGDGDTNASRGKPYDWVMMSPNLRATQVPLVIGSSTYTSGLVFDSRVYTPLSEVSPVLQTDSGAVNMQHMGVVVDVQLPGT